jgi:hypothetical protein
MNIRWLSLGALICCQLSFAQTAIAQKPADPLDEVEINAQREKLSVMRAEMVKLEERFYGAYNKLNSDDQYDIVCAVEAPTGSNIHSRVCRPVFVNRATEEEAQGFLLGYSVPPAKMVILAKSPDYEKNVLAVINQHPELRRIVREREALEKRYELVRKKKFKGRLIVWD